MELRKLIREEARNAPHNPKDVAERVIDIITEIGATDQALAEALPTYCREVMTGSRSQNMAPTKTPQNRSSKVTALREGGRDSWLDTLYPNAKGEWIPLRDFTIDDVLHQADVFHQTAQRNLAREKQFRAIAANMRATGAATVGDLNDADTASGGAA